MGTLAVHIRTKPDSNGLDRHGWLIVDASTGHFVTFVYAGRKGNRALTDRGYGDAIRSNFLVDVSVKEFGVWKEVGNKR